ncbi:serum amyloid A-5 protein [Alligator sinensis]|uniref:Serum amyloid A protein n=1 Tax=Alligator sinensis TaxID=38654 RepID=A0A3Q0GDY8_ALLSI|nr:serum amyloid A-5 protein [Alligator sinensis]
MKFFTCIFLLSLVLCVTSDNWAQRAGKFMKDAYGATTVSITVIICLVYGDFPFVKESPFISSSRFHLVDGTVRKRGAKDMARAYTDMREANWKHSDKYFHARGNRDAAQRGPGGAWAAKVISDARGFYKHMRGRDEADRRADQEANRWGRGGGDPNRYRPKNLPEKY